MDSTPIPPALWALLVAGLCATAAPVLAQPAAEGPAGKQEVAAPSEALLDLETVAALASGDQPALLAFEREAAASEQAAVAAGALPDPEVSVGMQNYPVIRGENAWSPINDDMTMYTIGIMREQIRRSRRETEAARIRAEALVSRRQGTARQREISREVMIAWINAVEARAKQRLLDRLISDLTVGRQVMEAGIPTGSSTPALALQAQAEIGLAKAQLAEARGQEARSRAEMARWIGSAAQRPLPSSIPNLAPPGEDEAAALQQHPKLGVVAAEQELAARRVDVARKERGRDISWSVMLGVRPRYGEMLSGQVSIPLRTNKRNLQDRLVSEAQVRVDAARLRSEDTRRELAAQYEEARADYRSAEAQLELLNKQAIPSLEASFEAAEARYRAGQGTLDLPLTVVRRYVEATLQSVEQQGRRARAAAELTYLLRDVAP